MIPTPRQMVINSNQELTEASHLHMNTAGIEKTNMNDIGQHVSGTDNTVYKTFMLKNGLGSSPDSKMVLILSSIVKFDLNRSQLSFIVCCIPFHFYNGIHSSSALY